MIIILENILLFESASKLTINAKKSNFVIFRPIQKKLNDHICLKIQDNNVNAVTALENKDYVKFPEVLIDKHLTCKQHSDYIASKISKIVVVIARLQRHEPLNTLLQIYRSLVFPYMY